MKLTAIIIFCAPFVAIAACGVYHAFKTYSLKDIALTVFCTICALAWATSACYLLTLLEDSRHHPIATSYHPSTLTTNDAYINLESPIAFPKP